MWYVYTNMYRMGVYFVGNKLRVLCILEKLYTRKTNN